MTKVAFFGNNQYNLDRVYAQDYRNRIIQLCDVHPVTITNANFEEQIPSLEKLEVIFSTWGNVSSFTRTTITIAEPSLTIC